MSQDMLMKIIQSNPQTAQLYQQLSQSQNPMADLQTKMKGASPQMQQQFQQSLQMVQGKDMNGVFNTVQNYANSMGFKL